MSNLPYDVMGQYIAAIQKNIISITQAQRSLFLPNGDFSLHGNIKMNGYSISGVGDVMVNTLHYTNLNPPISSGGNLSGPIPSVDKSILRYLGTSGLAVQLSPITISDDAKLIAVGGTIDMSVSGAINLVATNVNINSSPAVSSTSSPVVDSDIPIWDSTSGHVIKTSGISVNSIATKLSLTGGSMSGNINMSANNIIGVTSIAGSVKTSAVNDLLTCTASSATDSEIVVFNSTTGKIAKGSGVLVSSIAAKLPLAGGVMSGAIDMNSNNIINVGAIFGSVKESMVNDIITSASGIVATGSIPVWSDTTGRVLTDSAVAVNTLTVGAASSINNAIARFDSISGKLLKNSTVTISDDSKIAANGSTIDMSVGGVINFVAGGSVQINGVNVATTGTLAGYVQGPASATNNRLASFDLATGKLIKDSGILSSDVVIGPSAATNLAIARFDLTTGKLLKNSTIVISDDAKISSSGNVIDMSSSGVLNLSSASITANGSAIATASTLASYVQGPVGATDSNLAAFNLATGTLIKDSGIASANIVQSTSTSTDKSIARFSGTSGRVVQSSAMTISDDSKISASGGTIDMSVANTINLVATNVLANGSVLARTSDLGSYVQGPASAVGDNIATYNLTTGKLIKDSGVAIGQIANKLPLAGGTMSGNIDLGGNNVQNVAILSGTVKSNVVNDIVTSSAVSVGNLEIPIFDGTTGRIIKSSGITLTGMVSGPVGSTDRAIARFSGISGTLIQNSTVTISDDGRFLRPEEQ